MIGLKRGTVKLSKNNPKWVNSFEVEKKKLRKVFGKEVIDIQHIGSTAISNISAKPIIDIGVIVSSLKKVKRYIRPLKQVGYIFKKENRKDRLFFTKGPEKRRTHYLHIGELGSGYVEDMILFRDYLIKNKNIAKEYEILKKKLADQYSKDRSLYSLKKEKLILAILKKAKIKK